MRPRLFAELPAGLASVSLRLHGGANCRPPISRMGNKVGYAEVILAALGLRSGQGASAYLWAEADDDVAALLRCYPDASMLRRVAEIIRGWKDEEPRALWERLRAERKARASAGEVARWAALQGGAAFSAPVTLGEDRASQPNGGLTLDPNRDPNGAHGGAWPASTADACHRLAEYATIVSGNRLVNMAGPSLMNTGNGGTRHGGEFATPVGDVAAAFERVAGEVAAHAWMVPREYPGGGGFIAGSRPACPSEVLDGHTVHTVYQPETPAPALEVLASQGWPPVLVLPTIPEAADVAEWLGTPGDLEDCVVYMDPPYAGTTGYAATLSRDQVVRHARAYAELGAVVAISEAEVVIPEWDAVEITGGRRGQKRTFSRQQAEWLTMNRAPAHRVAVQAGLFAVGA